MNLWVPLFSVEDDAFTEPPLVASQRQQIYFFVTPSNRSIFFNLFFNIGGTICKRFPKDMFSLQWDFIHK